VGRNRAARRHCRIRTFLNYFLDRDMVDVRERQHSAAGAIAPECARLKGER
jgi:hypothetical protein